jgi:hypothetical protein
MTPYAGPVAASCGVISEPKHRINVKQEIMACEVGGEVEKVGLFLDNSISFVEKRYIFCLELIRNTPIIARTLFITSYLGASLGFIYGVK